VERFLDTPVKRYSSGMYVRLAFAVAAHLEPEILIVDEVLAVGDVAFQKKCLGKMQTITRQGRTVLFVSHSMHAIKSLCGRALLLDAGRVGFDGGADQAVDAYYGLTRLADVSATGIIPDDLPREWGTSEARLRSVQLSDTSGRPTASQLYFGQPFRIRVTFEALEDIQDAVFEVGIATLDGVRVTYSSNIDGGQPPASFRRGRHAVAVDLDLVLLPRQYTIDLGIHHRSGTTIDWVERALQFTVLNFAETGGDCYPWAPDVRGYVRPAARWHLREPDRPAADPDGPMPAAGDGTGPPL
jgi:lipopolysaccharide transport system ATP-binding protein